MGLMYIGSLQHYVAAIAYVMIATIHDKSAWHRASKKVHGIGYT